MQGRLFEQGWGKDAEEADFFRENLLDKKVNDLLRSYSMYQQIWGKNEDTLTWEEVQTKDEIEEFVSDVVWNRYWLRADIGSDQINHLVGKYLENPELHNSTTTDHLLVDLLDHELILLERDFHVGLFQGQGINVDTVTFFAATHGYWPTKDKRGNWLRRLFWQVVTLFISGLLIFNGFSTIQNPSSQNWFGVVKILIGILILIFFAIGWTTRLKYQRVRMHIAQLAARFQTIRFEIAEQPYHAKTLIERLKKLEDQGLGVNSLVYALLELKTQPT